MDFGLVDYSSTRAPEKYKCARCGARGCKLWREYQTCADYTDLFCCECGAEDQKRDISTIGEDGLYGNNSRRTDSIGWLVPAIPTVEGDTYWGYTSVPSDGIAWWRRLPTRPARSPAKESKSMKIFIVTHHKRRGERVNAVRANSKEEALLTVLGSQSFVDVDIEELPFHGAPAILWTYERSPDTPRED
jgi:hypothetical protein